MYVHVDPNHSIFTALFGRESMVFQNQKLHKVNACNNNGDRICST